MTTSVAEAVPGDVVRHAVGRLPDHACALQGVEERVAALQQRLTGVLEEQDALRQQRETTEKRLTRAARLTDALGEEGLRWRRTAEALQARPALAGYAAQLCEDAMQHDHLACTSRLPTATVEQQPREIAQSLLTPELEPR